MKLVLSENADADIRGIADYTLEHWGIDQAGEYSAGLSSFLDRLSAGAIVGRMTPDLRLAIRRAKYRSHFVFFERSATHLVIVRVLHEKMDHVRHLTGG